jgi:hypothetical protein
MRKKVEKRNTPVPISGQKSNTDPQLLSSIPCHAMQILRTFHNTYCTCPHSTIRIVRAHTPQYELYVPTLHNTNCTCPHSTIRIVRAHTPQYKLYPHSTIQVPIPHSTNTVQILRTLLNTNFNSVILPSPIKVELMTTHTTHYKV